jgi:hypothetical protein
VSAYNAEFNTDDVYLRYIIIALLAELRSKIYYYNYVDGNKVKIEVPFYYSVTGQERFLLDKFLFDALDRDKAVGDYERVPRGIIELDSASIDSGSLINKYVRGEFLREINGTLKTFSLSTQLIPLNLSFKTTIIASNNLEMFKIFQGVISSLYKSNNFYIDMGGFKVQSTAIIPEDLNQQRPVEFGFTDRKEYTIDFNIEVKSFTFIFENGIRLEDIEFNIGNSGEGIGVLRSDGQIYFGNVMETINLSIEDIKLAPIDDEQSNLSYNDLPDTLSGNQLSSLKFSETNVSNPSISSTESSQSKDYRNDT